MQYRAQGNVVLERLKGQPIPASMKATVKVFEKTHTGYCRAADLADATRAARDSALARVAEADAPLDASIETLAQKAAGAGLGTRQKPLASFTRYPVSQLRELAYKKEADEAIAFTAKVAKSGAPKDVVAAAATCAKHAKLVIAGLGNLVKPQAAYDKALKQRDALLPEWTRAHARLKKMAAAAWADDESTYEAVFAPASDIQAPKARRGKKKSVAAPSGNPPVAEPTA